MPSNSFFKPSKKSHKGFTLIEVLVALFILSTGILGAVAMQATAKKGSFDAMQRSMASALAQDIVERMRSNDATVLANYEGTDYGVTLDTPTTGSARCKVVADACTAAAIATNDRYEWERALMGADVINGISARGGLVDAKACITVANTNEVTVVITWQGRTEIANGSTEGCGGTGNTRSRQVLLESFVF